MSCTFYQIFYVFITPLFGIIFNIFYYVDCEGEASSVAHFSFICLNPLPDDGPMNDQIMSEK